MRYAFTQPHQQNWMTDGTMTAVACAEKAGIPIALMASNYCRWSGSSPTPSRPQADPRSLRPRPATARTTPRT